MVSASCFYTCPCPAKSERCLFSFTQHPRGGWSKAEKMALSSLMCDFHLSQMPAPPPAWPAGGAGHGACLRLTRGTHHFSSQLIAKVNPMVRVRCKGSRWLYSPRGARAHPELGRCVLTWTELGRGVETPSVVARLLICLLLTFCGPLPILRAGVHRHFAARSTQGFSVLRTGAPFRFIVMITIFIRICDFTLVL